MLLPFPSNPQPCRPNAPLMPVDHAALIALGERLGAQAWPGFLVLLALLTLVAGIAAWGFEHLRRRRAAQPEPGAGLLFGGLAIGAAAVLALAWVFAEVAEGLGNGRPMGLLDETISHSVGVNTPPGVREVFSWLTHLADPITVVLLCTGMSAQRLTLALFGEPPAAGPRRSRRTAAQQVPEPPRPRRRRGASGALTQARRAYELARGKGRIHANILWEMGAAERIITEVLEQAKGIVNGITCGAGMPYRLSDIAARFNVYYYPIVSSARAFNAL